MARDSSDTVFYEEAGAWLRREAKPLPFLRVVGRGVYPLHSPPSLGPGRLSPQHGRLSCQSYISTSRSNLKDATVSEVAETLKLLARERPHHNFLQNVFEEILGYKAS